MNEREKMLAALDEACRQRGGAVRLWEETVRERDSLREQLESVACRAATAELALEAARAASVAAGTEEERDEAIRDLISASARLPYCGGGRLQIAINVVKRLLTQPGPAKGRRRSSNGTRNIAGG